MSCVQLALDVDDLDEAIALYSKLFGTSPQHGDATNRGGGVCCGGASEDTAAAPTVSCC